MSALAPSPSVRGFLAWIEAHALVAFGVGLCAVIMLWQAPSHLNQDAWLGLVAGRSVAQDGLPQSDVLAVWTAGERWIDQQWLSQLAMYATHEVGGLALVVIVHAALATAGLALAVAAGRALGGSERHVLAVFAGAVFPFLVVAIEIRTQAYAYAFFAGVLLLIARDPVRRTRTVAGVLVLLVVWGNLHGSVVTGAGLAGLAGLTSLAALVRARRFERAEPIRAVALCLGPIACLLCTPYGVEGLGYYGDTLLNPTFRAVIREWQPVTTIGPVAVAYFVLVLAVVWMLGRGAAHATAFEVLALLVLAGAGISAVRNVAWFALAAMVLVPPLLTRTFGLPAEAPRRPRVNLAIAALTAAAVAVAVLAVAVQPTRWFERSYDRRALTEVTRAATDDPDLRIFADIAFADWLLWHRPQLAGRIAYDIRLELLSKERLEQLEAFNDLSGPDPTAAVRGFGLLVLDRERPRKDLTAILHRAGARPVLRGDGVVVADRR